MAWRVNALHAPALTQFGMNWGLLAASLFIATPTFFAISDTNVTEEDKVDHSDRGAHFDPAGAEDGVGDRQGLGKDGRGSSEGSERDVKERV